MNGQTIIIRKKKGGHGHAAHHGGAWKVAFADFMTAMMAFFLVMWILGLSESTRKSIAGYFREPGLFSNLTGKGNPMVVDYVTESLHRGDGSGATNKSTKMDIFNLDPSPAHDAKDKPGSPDEKLARQVAGDLRQLAKSSPALRVILGSITLQITAEGVRVELADNKEAAYFDVGSARPNAPAQQVLRTLALSLAKLPNKIEIEGHTDGRPFARGASYTNWELSADRANAVRKMLVDGGVDDTRLAGISGMASTQLRVPGQPLDVSNRRVALLLRHVYADKTAPTKTVPVMALGSPEVKPDDKPEVKPEVKPELKPEVVPELKPATAPAPEARPPAVAPPEPTGAPRRAGAQFQPITAEEMRGANH